MTYGLGSWGLDYWGADPRLLIQSAVAYTTHSVLVTLSSDARCISTLAEGDALNPATWTIKRTDDSYTWTVVAVAKLTPRRFVLLLRTGLHSSFRSHTLRSSSLLSPSGVLVSAPYEVTFFGLSPEVLEHVAAGPFDIRRDELGVVTTEAGGYARIYGDDVLRRMIIRRISTTPGSYFHIAEDEFGIGLKVKEPIKSGELISLKKRIEDEIRKEPGVVGALVRLSLQSNNLTISATVQTEHGSHEIMTTATR